MKDSKQFPGQLNCLRPPTDDEQQDCFVLVKLFFYPRTAAVSIKTIMLMLLSIASSRLVLRKSYYL